MGSYNSYVLVTMVMQEWRALWNETKFFSFTGYFLGYTLTSYMDNIIVFDCSGISTIGVGDQGVFDLGIWMTV